MRFWKAEYAFPQSCKRAALITLWLVSTATAAPREARIAVSSASTSLGCSTSDSQVALTEEALEFWLSGRCALGAVTWTSIVEDGSQPVMGSYPPWSEASRISMPG